MRAGAVMIAAGACLFGAACNPRSRFDAADAVEAEGLRLLAVPHVRQTAEIGCGPASLAMVLAYWGDRVPAEQIARELTSGLRPDVASGELRDFARKRGLEAKVVRWTIGGLLRSVSMGRPVIVPRTTKAGGHFEVLVGYHEAQRFLVIDDPAGGVYRIGLDAFMRDWSAPGVERTAVLIAPAEGGEGGTERGEP